MIDHDEISDINQKKMLLMYWVLFYESNGKILRHACLDLSTDEIREDATLAEGSKLVGKVDWEKGVTMAPNYIFKDISKDGHSLYDHIFDIEVVQ